MNLVTFWSVVSGQGWWQARPGTLRRVWARIAGGQGEADA